MKFLVDSNPPNGWELVGSRNGKPHYRYIKADNWYFTGDLGISTKYAGQLSFESVISLTSGCICPRCKGTGRYKWHSPERRKVNSSVCFWCNDPRSGGSDRGKGYLDERDLYYIFNALAEDRLSFNISA